jgi:hypothetical protein
LWEREGGVAGKEIAHMKRILMLMAVAALMAAMIVFSAVPALAQHRHILTTPNGNQNEIGVPACDVPQIPDHAFNKFHSVIHAAPNDVRAASC